MPQPGADLTAEQGLLVSIRTQVCVQCCALNKPNVFAFSNCSRLLQQYCQACFTYYTSKQENFNGKLFRYNMNKLCLTSSKRYMSRAKYYRSNTPSLATLTFRETMKNVINVGKIQKSSWFKLASANTPHELHPFQILQSSAPELQTHTVKNALLRRYDPHKFQHCLHSIPQNMLLISSAWTNTEENNAHGRISLHM